MQAFEALGISEKTLAALEKKGFKTPSPIQEKAIPLLLNTDKDVIGQAQTGTGKTAAFGIPIIERIDLSNNEVQALVLTPTRELAMQVCEEIGSLADDRNLKMLACYGGDSIGKQMSALERGVHIVVGTPGRVMDLLNRRKLVIDQLKYAVLDEADEMLNMGFLEDVETILDATNDDKQILLFSATMPKRIMDLAKRTMGAFEVIKVQKEELTTTLIDQMYYQVAGRDFFETLCRVLEMENDVYGIVFCNTRREVSELNNALNAKGYKTDAIHGDIEQKNRERVISKFKDGDVKILVATDVAARGIDVSNLTHVFNYGLPQDIESYVHRIGRTGRAGMEGKAISILKSSDLRKLANIEKIIGTTIDKEKAPDADLMVKIKKERLRHSLLSILEKEEHKRYLPFTQELIKENDAENVIAALLNHFYHEELDPVAYNEVSEGRGKKSDSLTSDGEVRLFVAKGKDDGMNSPRDLLQWVTKEAGVSGRDIQQIKIFDSFSFFNTPEAIGEQIVDKYRKLARKGGKPLVVVAKERGDSGDSGGFRGRKKRSGESGGGKFKNKDSRGKGKKGAFPKKDRGESKGRNRSKKKRY
ncbi:MAG: DEAD/DEAH box helicase [Chitinophagales bacterium]